MPENLLAIGVDGARGGWVAVGCYGSADDPKPHQRRTIVKLCRNFAELLELRDGTDAVVAIDIPMGLLATVDFRPCDREAREILGERRSTVFAPPARPLLDAMTYAEARGLVEQLRQSQPQAKSLSTQAFALAPKIKELDGWLRSHPHGEQWLYEAHPELSFRAMAGGVLPDKKTAHGQVMRTRLAVESFPDALDTIASTPLPSRDAQLADVLDAYAALDSALHVLADDHEQLGGERDDAGLVMRIIF